MKKQKQTEIPNSNNLKQQLTFYTDLTIRSLISFLVMTTIAIFVRNLIPYYVLLPAVFILSIVLSPLYNKIKIAHLFIDRYIALLDNIIYKLNKRKIVTQ